MTNFQNVGGVWKVVSGYFANVGGVWKTVASGFVNVAGVWKVFFTSITTPAIASQVTISTASSSYSATLTGTNYNWTDTTSSTYIFQSSPNNSTWTTQVGPNAMTNPGVGSSNTVTWTPLTSHFTASPMYFRFSVTASNSTFGTSATSTSASVTQTYPAPTAANGSWSGAAQSGSSLTYAIGATTNATSQTTYIIRADSFNSVLATSTGTSTLSYTCTGSDVGFQLYAFTTANGPATSTTSSQIYTSSVTVFTAPPAVSSSPSFSGGTSPVFSGTTLTQTTGSWTGTPAPTVTSYIEFASYSGTFADPSSSTYTSSALIKASSSGTASYTVTNSDAAAPSYWFRGVTRAVNASGIAFYYSNLSYTLTSGASLSKIQPSVTQSLGSATSTNFVVTFSATPSGYVASTGTVQIYNSGGSYVGGGSGVSSPYTTTAAIASGTQYRVNTIVSATDSSATTGQSADGYITTTGGVFAPNQVSGTAFSSGAPLSFSASWSAPAVDSTHSAATSYGYWVQAGTSSTGPWSNVANSLSATASSNKFTTSTSISGTITPSGYSWVRVYVYAINSAGSGATSNGMVG